VGLRGFIPAAVGEKEQTMVEQQRLAELVVRMREAQKEARHWRDQAHYIAARQLEREVDALLLQIIHERQQTQQEQR